MKKTFTLIRNLKNKFMRFGYIFAPINKSWGFTPLQILAAKMKIYYNAFACRDNFFPQCRHKPKFVTGFTLVELLVAVVILAILVTLAIPTYMRMVERAKQREAISTLNTIYAAERVYRTERQTYVGIGTNSWANLNIDNPDDNDFTYTITTATTTIFNIRATRRQGPFAVGGAGTIDINQAGTITQSYNP